MSKVFHLGKIDYYGSGRKVNEVTVTIDLRRHGGEKVFTIDENGIKQYTGETVPTYLEFTASGSVWNSRHTDILLGGQCLDGIIRFRDQLKHKEIFDEVYVLWKNWHLNGMHAGTPEQEAAIKAWKACGNKYDYNDACDFLKKIGLYEAPYKGLAVGSYLDTDNYQYGTKWLIRELPEKVLARIEYLMSA